MFNASKYTLKYYGIILNAKNQDRKKSKDGTYYETHHIMPESIWPQYKNCKWNKILLTPKEHYIAHLLLLKMTSGKHKSSMWYAFNRMNSKSKLHNGERYTSKMHQFFRQKFSDATKGKNHPMFGKTGSQHHFFGMVGDKHPAYGLKKTEAQKDKIRQGLINKPKSIEHKNKISISRSKNWLVTFPDGTIIPVTNLRKFCENYNVDYSHLARGYSKGLRAEKSLED